MDGFATLRSAVAWIVVLGALVADAAVSIVNVDGLLSDQKRVDHSYELISQLEVLLSGLKDAETGQRGFIITGQPEYLQPYDEAVVQVRVDFERLRETSRDDPELLARVDQLQPLIDGKMDELARTVAMARTEGQEAARSVVLEGQGHHFMTGIRTVARQIREREKQMLAERDASAHAKYRFTVGAMVFGSLLTIGITSIAFQMVRMELRIRRETEEKLRRRQEELRQSADDLALEQRHTADALDLLESFLVNAPIGFASLDEQTRITRANRVFADVNEAAIPYLLGRSMSEVGSAYAVAVAGDLQHLLLTHEPVIDRHVSDGQADPHTRRTWQTSLFLIRQREPGSLGIGIIVRDVSRRLQNERALRESQSRFRNLADAMPQLVWVARSDGFVEYFNRRWFEYTGLALEETIGFRWGTPIHPDDRGRAEERWNAAIHSAEEFEIEFRLRRSDGVYRWFLGRALPQRDENGQLANWFGTNTDIHDQKETEQDLQHSLARFRYLSESIPQIVWTSNSAGIVDYHNQHWVESTGRRFEAADHHLWYEIAHPDDYAQAEAIWREATQKHAPYRAELRIRSRVEGEYRWHLADAAPLHDSIGQIIQWIGTLTNVDDRKRQADLLEQLVRERTAELSEAVAALADEVAIRKQAEDNERTIGQELRRSNQELEKFAYIASHDLQEPLRKIQTFADRLMQKCQSELSDHGKEYLERIRLSATRMRTLIEDLLSFSRITTNPRPFTQVNLTELVKAVVADLDDRLAQTGGRIEVGTLPTIAADPSQLHQLFQNLIVNALKFHRPGVAPVVVVQADGTEGDERMCRIRIRDNGIGFEEQFRERIFQIFQRLHGRSEYEGTGIGLAICRKIVERHGGHITADSAPGAGATFTVVLPVEHD